VAISKTLSVFLLLHKQENNILIVAVVALLLTLLLLIITIIIIIHTFFPSPITNRAGGHGASWFGVKDLFAISQTIITIAATGTRWGKTWLG